MSIWLRLYCDVLDDPKVQRLPADDFRGWINLLCLAKEGDGLLPSIEDIAFRLRIPTEEAQRLTEELVERGLLETDGVNITPHNWHNRQFYSDASTERVKRFRNAERNVSVTGQSRDRAETETEQSRAEQSRAETVREKPRTVRAAVLPDDEYLERLQKDPAYSMLNVRLCFQRMCIWCENNNKQPSRRRFINWLNREDKPMTSKETGNGRNQIPRNETHNERAFRETAAIIEQAFTPPGGDISPDTADTAAPWIAGDVGGF